MDVQTLKKQLEEFQLIRCSLLPGEIFTFLEDTDLWNELLEIYETNAILGSTPTSPAQIQVTLEAAKISFRVEVPTRYTGNLSEWPPSFSLKGENMTRIEQAQWHRIIEEKLQELSDTEYPIFQLLSVHLLPLLHEEIESHTQPPAVEQNHQDHGATSPPYHALLTSHHLISSNKRRSLQNWSASLSITGFAKVGYPGVIYAQGHKENVEEFVANIKAMQWLALRVRFVEPLEVEMQRDGCQRTWSEFQKVGEVVEEMRRLGREQFIVEMGIGSAGTK
ncbi:RWD domain-containing protein 2B [Hypsizygus marmoreus]|uniref:RWD domain-containing protein 2B n=1 Tax=Hypsizygus marmoreus TaxID=39966 RepID=A0A369JRH3_HYPMA|nr:RWD domain-containing protein 2B [Hypsizygus marmoreus]